MGLNCAKVIQLKIKSWAPVPGIQLTASEYFRASRSIRNFLREKINKNVFWEREKLPNLKNTTEKSGLFSPTTQ